MIILARKIISTSITSQALILITILEVRDENRSSLDPNPSYIFLSTATLVSHLEGIEGNVVTLRGSGVLYLGGGVVVRPTVR